MCEFQILSFSRKQIFFFFFIVVVGLWITRKEGLNEVSKREDGL